MKVKVSVANLGEEWRTVFYVLDSIKLSQVVQLLLEDGWNSVLVEPSEVDISDLIGGRESGVHKGSMGRS